MRKRSFGPTTRTFWLWFGGIWLGVGLPFLCIGLGAGVYSWSRHDRLDRDGRVTTGMVLTRSISSEDDSGTRHSLTYRFVTPAGRTLRDEARVGPDARDRLTERGPVQVTYLPGDPQVHRVEGEERGYVLSRVFSALGGLLTLLGGFVLLWGWAILRRTRRGSPPGEAHAWHAGDREIVRLDDRDPARSMWVGKVQ